MNWLGSSTVESSITGVRKYIYESSVLEDKDRIISDALDVFLAGFERVNESSPDVRRAPIRVAG
ncbi:hypothetical protein [Bradyrhizobium sp. AUGA SZCCT0274]|uniref:hypothetical protein n=1 Tax=Bradyrhizobium sp. AUGA SZCCT0274 TaxID=2807670 RepID=UPI0020118055|nr:hypothetical protein [Bradyrhizobium sp. AUGA SZCCT0274]